MPLDATQALVGVSGHLYTAPVGTAFPATTAAAWTNFTDVGYLDVAGPSLTPGITSVDILTWQSQQPLRSIQTARTIDLAANCQQTTGTVMKLAFGGGTITDIGGGDYSYAPPALGTVDEHAFGLEVLDGTTIVRYKFYRAIVKNVGAINFKKDSETHYDLTISLLVPASGDTFNVISNSAALLV